MSKQRTITITITTAQFRALAQAVNRWWSDFDGETPSRHEAATGQALDNLWEKIKGEWNK